MQDRGKRTGDEKCTDSSDEAGTRSKNEPSCFTRDSNMIGK